MEHVGEKSAHWLNEESAPWSNEESAPWLDVCGLPRCAWGVWS
jgi:hypothetical protein